MARYIARECPRCGDYFGVVVPEPVGSYQSGPFRCSVAYWIENDEIIPIESIEDLEGRVDAWNGNYSDPDKWLRADREAQSTAERHVRHLKNRAHQRETGGLNRQISAARLRLQRELGRYLTCLGNGTDTTDLNGLLHRQITRDISSAQRLKKCLERFGGYPEWSPTLCLELEEFAQHLSENRRKARLLGKEIDAALEDPRWQAQSAIVG